MKTKKEKKAAPIIENKEVKVEKSKQAVDEHGNNLNNERIQNKEAFKPNVIVPGEPTKDAGTVI